MKLGLSPVLVGTGIAVEQSPEPGAMIRRGSRITVRFARGASLAVRGGPEESQVSAKAVSVAEHSESAAQKNSARRGAWSHAACEIAARHRT